MLSSLSNVQLDMGMFASTAALLNLSLGDSRQTGFCLRCIKLVLMPVPCQNIDDEELCSRQNARFGSPIKCQQLVRAKEPQPCKPKPRSSCLWSILLVRHVSTSYVPLGMRLGISSQSPRRNMLPFGCSSSQRGNWRCIKQTTGAVEKKGGHSDTARSWDGDNSQRAHHQYFRCNRRRRQKPVQAVPFFEPGVHSR
jgi:hypothetical protein